MTRRSARNAASVPGKAYGLKIAGVIAKPLTIQNLVPALVHAKEPNTFGLGKQATAASLVAETLEETAALILLSVLQGSGKGLGLVNQFLTATSSGVSGQVRTDGIGEMVQCIA
ncbi:MAG: hypothetical protein ACR2PI_23330, partial [Hyphomicrobiaceae bacterium]